MTGLCWACYAEKYGAPGEENTLELPLPMTPAQIAQAECARCGAGCFNHQGKRIKVRSTEGGRS